MPARLPASLCLAVCTSLVSVSAIAQQEDASIERIVTTGNRIAQPSPAGIIVSGIDEDTLALVSPMHIEEVLKFVAGAGVQRGNGQEYLPALRSQVFTGAGACGGLLTAEDDIPLRAAGFCNINELFEAHTEMAQRIEVLKGPGSALYGSNAIHGVVNVITPDTTRDAGLLGVDYGSYGYSRYKLRHGEDFGTSGIGINASITRDSGYRANESVHQEKVNLRHRYEFSDVTLTSGLTYTNLDQDTAGYIEGFESYKNETLAQQNGDPEAFRKNRALRIWSKAQWSMDNGDSLVVTPYYRDQNMDFLMHFLPGQPLEKNAQQGVGVQSLYQHDFSRQWQLQAGIDAEYTEGSLSQFQDGPTQGSAFLVATVPEGLHYDYEVDATMIAPFAALTWQHDAWEVTAAARFESMEYDYTNYLPAGRTRADGTSCPMGGCRYARPPSSSDDYSNFSPKLRASYALNDNLTLYGNIARGYRAPQATELYRLQRDQQVADLDSETVTSIEAGLEGQYQGISFTLAAYSMDKENVIFRDSDFFTVSDGETRHQGIELEFMQQLTAQWDLAVAASYASHTYEYDEVLNDININGNDIDTAPDTLINTRLGWQVSEAARVQLEWQHVSDYYTDPENLHAYEGHDLFHLRSSWSVTNALTVFARVNNLTDERYAERADYSSFSGDRYFPGRPRNYMLSVQYSY